MKLVFATDLIFCNNKNQISQFFSPSSSGFLYASTQKCDSKMELPKFSKTPETRTMANTGHFHILFYNIKYFS